MPMILPKVGSMYGAPMGRGNIMPDGDGPHRATLGRVRLDAGGYDAGGAYWGIGAPLWRVVGPDLEAYRRADTPGHAWRGFAAEVGTLKPCGPWAWAWPDAFDPCLQGILSGYLAASVWVDGERLPDGFGVQSIAMSIIREIHGDCKSFIDANRDALAVLVEYHGVSWEQHGHDLKLTRDGHGAGFWDRGYGAAGDALADACQPMGPDDRMFRYWKASEHG